MKKDTKFKGQHQLSDVIYNKTKDFKFRCKKK